MSISRRTETIALRFVKAENLILLTQLKGPGNVDFSDVAEYRLADMEQYQFSLARKLEAYQRSASVSDFESLVREGARAYRAFVSPFDEQAKVWWRSVIRDRKSYSSPILELTVLDTLTIPFGLFYVEDPERVSDWSDYKEVVRGFIGVDMALHKIYRRKRRLQNSMASLCGSSESPRVLHSIDQSLPSAHQERENWPVIGGQATIPKAKNQLVAGWTNVAMPPHLVHCSCHLAVDRDGRRYVSCCEGEKLYVYDLEDTDITMPVPPFVFLNSCSGGVIGAKDRDNFVWSLFPKVAAGFIATTCDVSDTLAAEMARFFYRHFTGGAEILTALHESIRVLVLEKGKLGALAYALWESNPHLYLRRPS